VKYTVEYKKSALKELAELPENLCNTIIAKVAVLAENPAGAGNVKALKGEEGYRLRVGDYRVVYTLEHKKLIVEVVRIAHRKDVYK
jgi:mRNA interferase RelE/StbE